MAPRPVFLHGVGGGTSTWSRQEQRFEGCYVLALPGHPAGTPLRTVGGNAEWLAHSLRDLPGSNVLVGHALGGAIAMHLSLIAPEQVSGLVLVSSAARFDVADGRAEAAREDLQRMAGTLVDSAWPGADDATREEEVARIVENGAEALARDHEAMAEVDLTDRLHEIDVPTLIMVGTRDTVTPPSDADVLAEGIRGSTLVRIPDAGHLPMKEREDTVSLLLAGFLAHVEIGLDG